MISALLTGLLLQATPFTPMEYPGFDPELNSRIRTICPAPRTTDRGVLRTYEESVANRVRDARSKATAAAWSDVACARALLAALGAPARESYLMHAGSSWSAGAIDAARRAVTITATERPALELLSALALGDPNLLEVPELARLLSSAANAGVTLPSVLRACSELSLRGGDSASTRRCAEDALAQGVDSTWHQLRLARLAFRNADTLVGVTHFLLAAASASDAAARREVDWHLQWFLSPEEREAWEALPDSLRGFWVQDRLIERDLRDGHGPGSRLAEHFARLEYVERNFRLAVPKMLREAARTGASIVLNAEGGLADPEGGTDWREYQRWQVDFDDRGVIWMRFGKPDQIAIRTTEVNPGSSEAALATWRYEIDGQPMLVHFKEADYDGSSGTTNLAVDVLGEWQCGIDIYRCQLATNAAAGTPLWPEQLQRLREQDREYITAGTTKDDNSPRGMKVIRAVGLASQIWDATTEAPMTIIAFGVRVTDLAFVRDSAGGETAEVAMRFRRWHPETAEWIEDSLPSTLAIPKTRNDDTHATGFRVFPAEGGIGSWGLTVAQGSDRWGRAYANTTPLSSDAVALSDLIVAPESRGLSWVHRGERIFLSPGGIIRKGEPLRLFYQIRTEGGLPGSSTRIELSRITEGVADSIPAISLGFASPLQDGVNGSSRVLDLSQLPPGKYQLEVRVTSREGVVVTRRSAVIDIE